MRKNIFQAYYSNMVEYLKHNTQLSETEIKEKLKKYINQHAKIPYVKYMIKNRNGDFVQEQCKLTTFLDRYKNEIITPNGNVYEVSTGKKSFLVQTIEDKLKERKSAKKKMLEAAAKGDKLNEQRYNFMQASIKIGINSLIGAMGSSYNLFYDKSGFNAVTSLARSLIAHAYTATELLLGGNISVYSKEDFINHLIICKKHCKPESDIQYVVNKFNLYQPTVNDVFKYIHQHFKAYDQNFYVQTTFMDDVLNILKSCKQHELTFIYYYMNMKLIFLKNEHYFKQWLHDTYALIDTVPDNDKTIDDLKELDDDIVIMLTVIFNKQLNGLKPYELKMKNKEFGDKFVKVGYEIQNRINDLWDVFRVFCITDIHIPKINAKKEMFRNTVIVSDTDSVIFTTKNWVEWYVGTVEHIEDKSFYISSFVIYCLTKVIEHILEKYSLSYGTLDEYKNRMSMKNEFLYPTLILYDIKKTYAGIVMIKEGIVLPKLKPDIKGQNLRSSLVCETSIEFIRNFIINDILVSSINNKINAVELINKVVKFENEIKTKLQQGDPTYLKMLSIKNKTEYKDPLVSAYFYYMFYCEVFEEVYGKILSIPTKTPAVLVVKPEKSYFEWLKKNYIKTYNKMMKFLDKYNRFPKLVPVNPDAPIIPLELRPVIDTREIIYNNLRPIYITLERLNINVGFEKKKILFSDIYHI